MTSKIKINQFKWLAALLLLVAAMVMPSTAWAEGYDENGFGSESDPYQPATLTTDKYDIDGDGTKDKVYEIGNAGQLYWFAELVNRSFSSEEGNESACAVLTADIEVSGTWTPIINYSGTFDGKGHTISGLKIDFVNVGCPLGLFGPTQNGSVIRNVGIVNCEFSVTQEPVGCVCGENNGTIENCYTTGSIKSGSENNSGCVCGYNKGTIKNCYNTGKVDGNTEQVGGVCGRNEGTIENCYYLSGTAKDGIYINVGTGSAEGKTEAQFKRGEVCYLLNGKKSEGTGGSPLAWYQNINGDSYPVLDSSYGTVYQCTLCTGVYSNTENNEADHEFGDNDNGFCHNCKAYQPATLTTDQYDIDGDDTKDNVYEIGNAGQLYWFAGLVNGDKSVCDYNADSNPTGTKQNKAACAVLTANIVVNRGLAEGNTMLESLEYDDSGNVTNGSDFVAWTPIGFNYQNYTGTFDGKEYTVSGLYFNDSSINYVGLFGRVDSGGKISNVGVLDSYFQFSMQGGGICGHNNKGEINNCTNSGTVIGNSTGSGAGGVCGMNYGTVKDCKNTGSVSGTVSGIGGVCGAFYSGGSIENCLNEGTVSGTGETTNSAYGGVCGHAYGGAIKRSYNTASVSGLNGVGGVCGYNGGAALEDCYNTGAVIGTALSSFGGVCGSNSTGSIKNCYNTGAVSGNNNVGGVCGKNSGTITNCYYLSGTATGGINGEDATGSAESKSLMHFTSGEVAYLLNGSSPYGEWGQQIYTNDYPVLGSAYKVLMAARDGKNGTNYWATFSNLDSNAELTAPTGNVTVYNATVSSGKLTLTKRSDNRVAKEEGVLLKATSEYVNAKNISETVSAAATEVNHLVATPKDAGAIEAGTGYTLYRLTYNDVDSKEGLGFYLGVVGDSQDGSKLAATPGKAYLKVATATVTQVSGAAIRGFAFPGNDDATGIECITVTNESLHNNGNADDIFDLQGRKVSKPTKGVYIKNNKLFLK